MTIAVAFDPAVAARVFSAVARRFRHGEPSTYLYIGAKLRRDPVHIDILALAAVAPMGHVLDLGCGRGQLGITLLEAGLAKSVTGCDRNPNHVARATRAGQGLAFTAHTHDLTGPTPLPLADTVLMIDVLYQLPANSQQDVLQRAAAAGKRLLIRTVDPGQGARSGLTRLVEVLTRRISPNAGSHVNPMPIAVIVRTLHDCGFHTTEVPCRRGTPFSNVLLDAHRAAMPDARGSITTALRSAPPAVATP